MKKISTFALLTIFYMIIVLSCLGFIIYGIIISDEKDNFFKAGVPTIIALVFGTSSKSLYQFLIQIPFNFEIEKFEEDKNRKNISRVILFVIDFISGFSVLIYILKISPLPPKYITEGISIISTLSALILTYIVTWNLRLNKKQEQS